MRAVLSAALVFSLGSAPYQCGGTRRDPPHQDLADDALWSLARELRANGDVRGLRETLRYLVTNYPSSRHAGEAKRELDALPTSNTGTSDAIPPSSDGGE